MSFIEQIRWRPQLGDPSVMGWVTVCAYALAAVLAVLAAERMASGAESDKGKRRMWWAIAVLMAFLCLNKQLDLQSLITDIGRVFAKRQGWYGERYVVQKIFVLGVLVASAVGTALLGWRFRSFWLRYPLLAGGLVLLLTFIVVRAISFHHVDRFLRFRVGGVKMNWFLELSGIAMIALAAMRDTPARKRE